MAVACIKMVYRKRYLSEPGTGDEPLGWYWYIWARGLDEHPLGVGTTIERAQENLALNLAYRSIVLLPWIYEPYEGEWD